MDMVNTNLLQTIAPGLMSAHHDNISVHENDDTLNVTIFPEKNSIIELYFVFPQEALTKKYLIKINFNHEYATVNLFGLYQLEKNQFADINTEVNHFVPHCVSKQLWRGVLQDTSKAVFEGKIMVAPHAQKTNAQLSNKNLFLSKNAEINTKPILEIYADDVKCSHDATVGFLDQEALFYFRSRGIEENIAREMLVQAFIDEVLAIS